ncbi:MAG: NAD+ synthase, partial [Nanoarchaeota archaeon]|nr:NAD+ synthase [Nanoarchaeota archaeon]
HKVNLPNYDVFDEKRYFSSGKDCKVFDVLGKNIGINICEDIWIDNGPSTEQCSKGAELIVNISASPFFAGKEKVREKLVSKRAIENKVPIIYANLVGGQDDLIFDGRSYLFSKQGKLMCKGKSFAEELIILPELDSAKEIISKDDEVEDTYKALVLALSDYFRKNGFKKTVIGLSGGIDSALTAAIAVEAIGKEKVWGISMPSKFSSKGSVSDSEVLAKNLGIKFDVIPIKEIYDCYLKTLSKQFSGTEFNIAEENIQARIRGNILMAMSNKFGHIVLATGNKSELSCGYATLYGDMSGGLALISDVLKTRVYEICDYINKKAGKEIIPSAIITKAPSAELRDNQKDSDSLPEYDILDPILKMYIEDEMSKDDIAKAGFDKELVSKVIKMVDRNEYKRHQAALGFRTTPKAFGTGRRMPITNRWGG